jgi:spore coat protein U-like protein
MRSSSVVRALTVTGAFTLFVGGAAPASAQTQANLNVAASVQNNCKITATSIAFSAYDPVGANDTAALNGEGSVSVQCTKGATPSIALSAGANASGTQRRLASGSERLNYALFSDSNRYTAWTTSTNVTLGQAPSKVARVLSVYAAIDGGQDVAAGTYTDVLQATVNF